MKLHVCTHAWIAVSVAPSSASNNVTALALHEYLCNSAFNAKGDTTFGLPLLLLLSLLLLLHCVAVPYKVWAVYSVCGGIWQYSRRCGDPAAAEAGWGRPHDRSGEQTTRITEVVVAAPGAVPC
jgi:hypothetical protein